MLPENRRYRQHEYMNLQDCMNAEEIYKALESASEETMEELRKLGLREDMSQEELIALFDQSSPKAFDELVSLDIFGPLVTFDQIMQLCSGINGDDGTPNSFAALSIDTVTEDMETIPYANVSFGSPVLNVYGAGGCIVVTADFDNNNKFEYRRTRDVLSEYIEKKGDPEFDNKLLSLTIFPVVTNGELMVILHELVFAQGFRMEDNVCRMIMAFDGNQTQEIMDSKLKLDELKLTVDAEMARREAEMRAYAEKATEPEEEEEKNEMDEMIEEQYTPSYLSEGMEEPDEDFESELSDENDEDREESKDDWMRIRKDPE